MKIIGPEEVHSALSYPALIDALQETFSGEFTMPPRNVFLLDESPDTHDAFAVLPSWNTSLIGVKAFTYFPSNPEPYKSLYSKILLFDRAHGEPLALVDGTTVTFWRTAAFPASPPGCSPARTRRPSSSWVPATWHPTSFAQMPACVP